MKETERRIRFNTQGQAKVLQLLNREVFDFVLISKVTAHRMYREIFTDKISISAYYKRFEKLSCGSRLER